MSTFAPEPLLQFWFGELHEGLAQPAQRAKWFTFDQAFDDACRNFTPALTAASQGHLDDWKASADGLLAFIILCDQLPRNIHRGDKRAFSFDHLALDAAKQAVSQGLDRKLGWDQRAFVYMPFEHSESLLDQHTAVGLFSALRDESSGELRSLMGNNLRFAQQHRDIILRFNRFPHRNQVLGRTSTPEEEDFIAGSDGFGQVVSPT